jgi:hypothetical protein
MCIEGELDRAAGVQVLEALRAAAVEAGLPDPEVARTITSAMRATP